MSLTFKLTDCPPEPSATVEELNNTLVKMRKVVKVAKIYTFRDLTRYVRKLRQKVEKTPTNQRLKRKLEHRTSELHILNQLSVIRLCKLLLANERNSSELSQSGHKMNAQDRLVLRVSATKPVTNFVRSFREAHPDWHSLVHYMLYKNISGKWKSREQKKRNRKVHGSLPLPPTDKYVALANENATDASDVPTTSYRVHADNSITSPPVPTPVSIDRPILDDPGLDSDAASDIADEVVSRLAARQHQQPVPTIPVQCSSATNQISEDTRTHRTEVPAPHMKVATPSSKTKEGKKESPKNRASHELKKPSRKKGAAPKSSVSPSQLDQSDDDNPLGSDDILMRQQLSRKQRQTGFSSAGRSRPPFVKPPATKASSSRFGDRKQGSVTSKQKSEPKSLHPSWQAKREEKIKTQLAIVAPTSQPKRIVFDD